MSKRASRHQRRHTCRGCNSRRPIFFIRGHAKTDRHHDLCQRCWRDLANRMRL